MFGGQTITGATTIAMYTWAGDVDLNGVVDAVDYGTIDNWIQFPGTTGYTNGDLNYDGVIDAVDYGIIDNGIQLQGAPIPINPEPSATTVGRDRGARAGVAVGDRPGGCELARSPPSTRAAGLNPACTSGSLEPSYVLGAAAYRSGWRSPRLRFALGTRNTAKKWITWSTV